MISTFEKPWNHVPAHFDELDPLFISGQTEKSWLQAYWIAVCNLDDLIISQVVLDVDNGEALPQLSFDLFRNVSNHIDLNPQIKFDWLLRTLCWAKSAMADIIQEPNRIQRREHQKVPPFKSKELDIRCLSWLAKQPGRCRREKIGGLTHMLAVVRPQTVDTHENRVVKRLVNEITPEIERIGQLESNGARQFQVEKLLDLLTYEFSSSDLNECPPAIDLRANNVLLGDGRYAKAWKLVEVLQSQSDRLRKRWEFGHRILVNAVALALASRFSNYCVIEESNWVLIEPEIELAGSERTINLGGKQSWICRNENDELLVLQFGIENELIRVRLSALGVESNFKMAAKQEKEILLIPEFGWEDQGKSQSEMHFRCHMEMDGELLSSIDYVGLTGLASCASWITKEIGITPNVSRQGIRTSLERKSNQESKNERIRRIGLDLSGAWSSEATNNSISGTTIPLVAKKCQVENFGTRWIAGNGACQLSIKAKSQSFYLDELLSREFEIDVQGRRAIAEILKSVLPTQKTTGSQIAIGVPDEFDEVDLQKLRDAIPAYVRKSTLIWRSVACAMAIRKQALKDQASDFKPGDSFVFVDSGSQKLNATLLYLRFDSESSVADPWYWERPAQFSAIDDSQNCTDREWQYVKSNEALREATRGQGICEKSHETLRAKLSKMGVSDFDEEIWLDSDNDQFEHYSIRLKSTHSEKADEQLKSNLLNWFGVWEDSRQCKHITSNLNGGDLHFVFFGRMFDRRKIQDFARDQINERFNGAHCHIAEFPAAVVAEGSLEYLSRCDEGLPSYVDVLPELFVKPKNTRKKILLFKKQYVRPGDPVDEITDQAFELPANQTAYLLNLIRDTSTAAPIDFEARIESPDHFPLKESVVVKASVRYRHAEDSFRVRLVPQTSQVFPYVEATWARSSFSDDSAPDLINDPPSFPEVDFWETVDSEQISRFNKSVNLFIDAHAEAFSNKNRDAVQGRRFDSSNRDLKKLVDTAEKIEEQCKLIWTSNRQEVVAPQSLVEHVAKLMPYLAGLGLNTFPLLRRKKKSSDFQVVKVNKTFLNTRDSKIKSLLGSLSALALRLMSRFRSEIPGDVAEQIQLAVRKQEKTDEQLWYAFGRTLNPDQKEIDELLDFVSRELAKFVDLSNVANVRIQLWILNTGFWTRERLVFRLGQDLCERIVDSIEAILEKLQNEWRSLKARTEVFSETNALILALLRLRVEPVLGDRFSAGVARMNHIAESIETLSNRFHEEDRKVNSRFAMASSDSDASEEGIAESTMAALRGERVAHIRVLEDK